MASYCRMISTLSESKGIQIFECKILLSLESLRLLSEELERSSRQSLHTWLLWQDGWRTIMERHWKLCCQAAFSLRMLCRRTINCWGVWQRNMGLSPNPGETRPFAQTVHVSAGGSHGDMGFSSSSDLGRDALCSRPKMYRKSDALRWGEVDTAFPSHLPECTCSAGKPATTAPRAQALSSLPCRGFTPTNVITLQIIKLKRDKLYPILQ